MNKSKHFQRNEAINENTVKKQNHRLCKPSAPLYEQKTIRIVNGKFV